MYQYVVFLNFNSFLLQKFCVVTYQVRGVTCGSVIVT